jgi:hypothetical protein
MSSLFEGGLIDNEEIRCAGMKSNSTNNIIIFKQHLSSVLI